MEKKTIKKLVPFLIVLFWVCMTLLLVYRHIPISGLGVEAKLLLPESRERWMGIYMNGHKIGFAVSRFYREIEGYSVNEELKIRLTVLGKKEDIHVKTSALLSPELNIRSFSFMMDATQHIEIKGKIRNKRLFLDIDSAGNKSTQEIRLNELPQMGITVLPYLIRKGLRAGTRLRIPVFDPATLSTRTMLVEFEGKEKLMLGGEEVEAFKIRANLNGVDLFMWVDEQGNELKEESPMGFTLIAEPRAEAIKLPDSAVAAPDIVRQASVPFNLILPGDITYLKVKLKGVEISGLELDGGRQSLSGNIMEVVKEDISGFGHETLPVSGMDEFLVETPFIQSRDQRIIDLAQKITGGERDSLSAARMLWKWTFKNIEKVPSITIPRAIDVYKTREGDCNEHTALYTALARSAGIPTRINAGLVYRDGSFYYHVWPEVFTGRWIAIDPALGQFPADASHIRLISGDIDKQMVLLGIINKISLEGIEYR